MKKHSYNKYIKGVHNTTGMLITETIGYGVAGKIAGMDTTGIGNKALGTGASLAGVPSIVYGAGNVINSLEMLGSTKKKRKR